MRRLLLVTVTLFFLFLFSGCPSTKIEYYEGIFPQVAVNFKEVNSVYDDYNSMLPVIQYDQYLFFSSNRNSNGQNFDIVGDNLHVWWDMETGDLTIDNSKPNYNIGFTDTLLQMMNTSANEFGPYFLSYWKSNGIDDYSKYDLVIYSTNNNSEDYNSKFVYYESDGNYQGVYHGPYNINMVNNYSNTQYISFLREDFNQNPGEVNPDKFDKMVFNKSVEGNTGIYSINLPISNDFIDMLKGDTIMESTLITELNSLGEDKCPFVNEYLIVFSSDREGGFGGYDLYYSWFENGTWTSPVNFGAEINTEYDEFRPVTKAVNGFVNDLMIFSSNRPGGKGGFDLYYVGLPFKLNNYLYINL